MGTATRKHFSSDLNELHQEILKMGSLVEDIILKALHALNNRDQSLANEVLRDDDLINTIESRINDKAVILLATEQPVAGDLRFIVSAIKAANELERIGDQAVHIAKCSLRIGDSQFIKPSIEIPRMIELCVVMIHDILSALVENNSERAKAIATKDDEIDELYNLVSREMISSMIEDNSRIPQGLELSFIARYIERIGDHITNIAELIVYNATGRRVELNR